MADNSNWYNFIEKQINKVLESETPSQPSHPTGGPSTLPPPLPPLLPHLFYLPYFTSMPSSCSTWPPLIGILSSFGCLSCPLHSGTKVAVSRDKYNVLLSGSNDGCPLGVLKYAILCYSDNISLLTIYNATSAPTPSTTATPCAFSCNPALFIAAIAAGVPIPKQWEADFTNAWGMNAAVGHYSWVGQTMWDNLESHVCD